MNDLNFFGIFEQKWSKSVILSKDLAYKCAFFSLASDEVVEVERCFIDTCLRQDLGTFGNTEGGSEGREPPGVFIHSQAKCDAQI